MSGSDFDAAGLTIIGEVDPRGRRAAEQLVSEQICGSVWYAGQADSTNTCALQQSRAGGLRGEQLPRLILADCQTGGRGRHGRSWLSDASSLTLSLLIQWPLRNDPRSRLLSLAVGVGVAQMLEFEFAPVQTRLKWPNDVYLGSGKVAGILVEGTAAPSGHMVIGVGLNVSAAPDLSSDPQASTASSIATATGRRVDRYDILVPLVAAIRAALETLKQTPDEPVREFRRRCLLSDQWVSFEQSGTPMQGRCDGIDQDGSLIVQTAAGTQRLHCGEARLLRRKARDQP